MKIYDYKGRKNLCGDHVREARLKRRLSQGNLAAKLQVQSVIMEQDCISRIESGDRFVADYELKALAIALGVSMEWLTEEDTE